MDKKAAKLHELSDTHKQRMQNLESWILQPDVDAWGAAADCCDLFDDRAVERMTRVDNLKDIIPFWRQQVEAANRGVELRFNDFLDELDRSKIEEPVWNVEPPAWAMADIAEEQLFGKAESSSERVYRPHSEQTSSGLAHSDGTGWDEAEALQKTAERTRRLDEDAYAFVENVARLRSVSSDRKRLMHEFFKVSTQEKVVRIQALARELRATA